MNGVATYTHQHTTNKSSAPKNVAKNIDLTTKTDGIEPREKRNQYKNLELATSKAQETKTSTKNTKYYKKR